MFYFLFLSVGPLRVTPSLGLCLSVYPHGTQPLITLSPLYPIAKTIGGEMREREVVGSCLPVH